MEGGGERGGVGGGGEFWLPAALKVPNYDPDCPIFQINTNRGSLNMATWLQGYMAYMRPLAEHASNPELGTWGIF